MKKKYNESKKLDKRQEIIIKRIAELLKEYKWTQVYLAYNSGISEPTLTNIMNGYTKPNDNTIQKIADAFGVYKEYLTGDIIYKNYNTWSTLFSKADLSENQKKALFDLLNCWGFELQGIENNLITFKCSNDSIKIITTEHLLHIINNMIVTFNAVLVPPEYTKTDMKNDIY